MADNQNVEKGFNDSELEDIMNEIECLEQEARADFNQNDSQDALDERMPEGHQGKDLESLTEKLDELGSHQGPRANTIAQGDKMHGPEGSAEVLRMDENDEMTNEISQKLGIGPKKQLSIAELEAINVRGNNDLQKVIDNEIKATQKELLNHSTGPKNSVLPLKQEVATIPTKMEFSVSGQMALHLSFTISGKKVELKMDGTKEFVIELDGGMRFSVPL